MMPVHFCICCEEEKHKLLQRYTLYIYVFNIAHILQPTSNWLVWTKTYHLVIEMTWNGHPKTCKYIFVAVCFFISCIQIVYCALRLLNTFEQFSRFFWLLRMSVGVAVVKIIRCYDPTTRPMEIFTAGQHHIISVSFSLVSINVENWILEASIWFGVHWRKLIHERGYGGSDTQPRHLKKTQTFFLTKRIKDA